MTFISHSSKGWDIQGQGANRFDVWWGPTPWIADVCIRAVSSHSRERERDGFSGVSSYKGTNPIDKGSTLTT